MRMRSGCSDAAMATPCAPSVATMTVKPGAREPVLQHVDVVVVVLDVENLHAPPRGSAV